MMAAIKYLVVLSLFALPTVAQAAVVYDQITVSTASGQVLASVFASNAEIIANPMSVFYVPGIAVDITQFGNYGIVIEDGVAVDIFGIATGGPDGYDLAFAPGEQAAAYIIQNPIIATGAPIDLTHYLDPALQAAGDTAFFTASGDTTISGVPEPASWVMLLAGMGAIGAALRRRVVSRIAPA